MAFLLPLVLAGLAATAAPVAIHLLNKMRVRTVKWAAMRFLMEAAKKNERRLQVEDLLLLLIRCLLVILLVLAFSRPVLNPGGADASVGTRAAVLILDQSASMGQSDGARTRMDLAKTAARSYLDKLGPGSQATLFLATTRIEQTSGPINGDLAGIRRLLDQAKPTGAGNDFPAVLRQAVESLRPLAAADREIVIFTDNQASAWKQQEEIRKLFASEPSIHLRVIAASEKGEDNLGITSLKPESLIPAANQPFGCLVEVFNFSESPATDVRVTVAVDNDPPSDEKVIPLIEAGKSGVVRLGVRFSSPGFHTLTASIAPDRLPADNQRSLALQVVDEVRMTIVEGTQHDRPQDREGFFLANALVPVDPARRAEYYLKVQSQPPSWIEDATLDREAVIFLADVSRLTPTASKKLRAYVLNGGSLVIFPGPGVDPTDYNNNKDLADLMPAKLEPAKDSGPELKAWQADSYAHPVAVLWNGLKSGSLGTVSAKRYFPLSLRQLPATLALPKDAPLAASAAPEVIVNYADGTPAVAEMAAGKGRVVLFSSTANTKWTNLQIHPNFVPFLSRLTGHLSKFRSDLNLQPGTAFQMPVLTEWIGREFLVVRPDGETHSAGKVERSDHTGLITYRDTLTPGGYRLQFSGGDHPLATFSVQVNPAESDLSVFTGDPADFKNADAPGNKPATTGGPRRELWGFLLLLALVVALVEMALAHKFSLAK